MANKVTSMQTLRLIIQMLDRNVSERNISRQLHISRNTVKFYRERLLMSPYSFKQLQALDDNALSSMLYCKCPIIADSLKLEIKS